MASLRSFGCPRARLLWGGGLAGVLGLGAALLGPSSTGCIIPDKCILVTTPGRDRCRLLVGAQMWPIGQPEEAVTVQQPNGGPPQGCVCFNSAEQQVLGDKAPADYAATLEAKIEQAARDACDALVPGGYNHNCYEVGPEGPQPETSFVGEGFGDCVGDCAYTDDCGDPNPYECEAILGEAEPGGPDGAGETGGGPPSAGSHVYCSGTGCEIDEGFARALWLDPSPLLEQGTRLIYDPELSRFVFDSVDRGTVAAELGFVSGDVLESVNGVVIDELDAALEVYSQSGGAAALRVRVARSSRWLDFTFTFVP